MWIAWWQETMSPTVPRCRSSTAAKDSSALSSSTGMLDQDAGLADHVVGGEAGEAARTASSRARWVSISVQRGVQHRGQRGRRRRGRDPGRRRVLAATRPAPVSRVDGAVTS